jgi:CTP:phosphocholine cytidylyltransferase-like protein
LSFKESKGSRVVKNTFPAESSSSYTEPLKLHKVNIGSEDHPKIASIGDYWDEQTMTEIQALLHEYEDLFLKNFSELKGIKGNLGEMKIELKPGKNL